jgi:TRAP-type C4-dicarboxylate transport system permease small subunit
MNALRYLNSLCISVAGMAILAITLLGAADVVSTALLGEPIAGVYESTQTLMVLVVFLSLGFLQSSNGNIAVDVLTSRLSRRARAVQVALAELLGLAFFALLAWQGWLFAVDSFQINEYSAGLVRFPLYPAKFALAIGAAMTALTCAVRLARLPQELDRRPEFEAHAD